MTHEALVRRTFQGDSFYYYDIVELEKDSQRLDRICRTNVHIAALLHDWLYCLRVVMNTLKLLETDAMITREKRLESIAKVALGSTASPIPITDLQQRV